MIKITKEGKHPYFTPNPRQVYRATCNECHAEMEALEKDLRRTTADSDNLGWAYGSAPCRRCPKEFIIFRPAKGLIANEDGTIPEPPPGFLKRLWRRAFGAKSA